MVHALREEALARGFHTIIRPALLSPYVTTQGPWTAYQATLGVKLKSEIRRRTRRLQELGEFTLDVVSGAERLDDLLSEGFRVEQSGWKEPTGQRSTRTRVPNGFIRTSPDGPMTADGSRSPSSDSTGGRLLSTSVSKPIGFTSCSRQASITTTRSSVPE